MRPNQQNRRMRGRGNNNNNNRKGQNPLTRSYESNGPDVKIRGTAQQVAEKYMTLARDSQSSGDRVIAENYLQHAEHYNRLVAAAQAQANPQNNRDSRDDNRDYGDDDDDRDDNENAVSNENNSRNDHPHNDRSGNDNRRDKNDDRSDAPAARGEDGSGPQPVFKDTPTEFAYGQDRQDDGGRSPETSSKANGANGAHAQEGDEEPRRPRRPRKPRVRKEEGDGAPSETQGKSDPADVEAGTT